MGKRHQINELFKKDREKLTDLLIMIAQGLVCDCCEAADMVNADRDEAIMYVVSMVGSTVKNGTFRNFDIKNGRKTIGVFK